MRSLTCKPAVCAALAVLAVSLAAPAPRAAEKPLTQDEVTLLLIGGASASKVADIIKQRGIAFRMTAELANEFRRDGADESVIQALDDASAKANPEKPAAASPAAPGAPSLGSAPQSATPAAAKTSAAPPPAIPKSPQTSQGPTQNSAAGLSPTFTPEAAPESGPPLERKNSGTLASAQPAAAPSSGGTPAQPAVIVTTGKAKPAELADPTPERVQQIIQAFAAKELQFKQARDNYTFHQINKVQEIGPDGEVTGQFQQDWDILYDDNGARIERVTFAPLATLHQIGLTEQDMDAFRRINPFVLTTDELPDYDVQYRGHVKVDQITAYVFSIRPKVIQKGRQYFQGMVWVDDRDLQIVKSEGKQVPEIKTKNNENLFPHFTTWREQIDGKFWFPTFTLADDTLYFTTAPVHIKEVIRYTDYKQFKTSVKTRVIGIVNNQDQQQQKQKNPPKP